MFISLQISRFGLWVQIFGILVKTKQLSKGILVLASQENREEDWELEFSFIISGREVYFSQIGFRKHTCLLVILGKNPKGCLNLIKNRLFNFLWSCHKERGKFHTLRWENLARPTKFGGWSIKNIFLFGSALAAKNSWRALFTPGMWKEVIYVKYLKKCNMIDQIR